MTRSGVAPSLAALLAGCTVMPDLQDKTPPQLDVLVYYSVPNAPFDFTSVSGILTANKCIYVGPLFRVAATARDPGGVSYLKITDIPTGTPVLSLQTYSASPAPGESIQTNAVGQPYPNPGTEPFNPNDLTVTYYYPDSKSGGKVHSLAELEATYGFLDGGGDVAALLVVARNSSLAGLRSEVNSYFVRQAGAQASQQPGKPCKPPAP
jgi:hypothetical protein